MNVSNNFVDLADKLAEYIQQDDLEEVLKVHHELCTIIIPDDHEKLHNMITYYASTEGSKNILQYMLRTYDVKDLVSKGCIKNIKARDAIIDIYEELLKDKKITVEQLNVLIDIDYISMMYYEDN